MTRTVVGVDVGTSSTKGVLVALDGRVLRSAAREHVVERPKPSWVEMDAVSIEDWNPVREMCQPRGELVETYAELYGAVPRPLPSYQDRRPHARISSGALTQRPTLEGAST